MKIVFIGTVDFSYQALKALIINGFDIVGVITKKNLILMQISVI